MANSELSKLKILFMYEYFKTAVNAYDADSSVSVNDLIKYLEIKTGTTFERKSIYADINKINDFIGRTQKVKYGDCWITTEGKRYRRNELEDEISTDEARLIVDAINTTAFVDTELCKKIIKMFPTYFDGNYSKRALLPHDEKINRRMISWLNSLRGGIENKEARKISYGYKLGSELMEKTDRIISPLALDWENNCYYVIAIDNAAAKDLDRDEDLSQALRRYRLDRIAQVSYAGKAPYIDYDSEKTRETELKRFVENSVSAFSGDKAVLVNLTIKGKTRKDALKAYGAFSSRIRNNNINIEDDTKLDKGILKIRVRTGHAPTLYTDLFELSTFENVEIEIDSPEICAEYAGYIRKAAQAAKLDSL